MSAFLKYVLPVLIILAAAGGTALLVRSKSAPAHKDAIENIPDVEYVTARMETVQLEIESQGLVTPRIESTLVAEVSGVVEWISPVLYDGGFFDRGEPLIRIEQTQYLTAVANARSTLAQMELLFLQEEALAEQARTDWQALGGSEPGPLVLREPQLEKARADLAFARANLALAERDLGYTEVRAPYDGRVRRKLVEIGESVSPKASPLVSIYSVGVAEIALTLNSDDLAHLSIPEIYRNGDGPRKRPRVDLFADYAGQIHQWTGVIDRVSGEIDPQTRLSTVVAVVENPYGGFQGPERPPLKIGMFVEARIQGDVLRNAFRLPKEVLHDATTVYVIDEEDRLRIRAVEVVRFGMDDVIVSQGLEDGDRLVTTPLTFVVEGMKLQPIPPVVEST